MNSEQSKSNISFIKDSFFQYNRIDPNKNFENFIIGPSNKLAFELVAIILSLIVISPSFKDIVSPGMPIHRFTYF